MESLVSGDTRFARNVPPYFAELGQALLRAVLINVGAVQFVCLFAKPCPTRSLLQLTDKRGILTNWGQGKDIRERVPLPPVLLMIGKGTLVLWVRRRRSSCRWLEIKKCIHA